MHEIVKQYPDVTKILFEDFFQRIQNDHVVEGQSPEVEKALKKVKDIIDRDVLITFSTFNQSIIKTNFNRRDKSATAFVLDPRKFLKNHKLPEIPYSLYLFIGREFQGFHIRFRDISRGGVRLIKSSKDNFNQNKITLFHENFGLAFTQKFKNKDLAESGSKGTILMNPGKNHMGHHSFMQYIDSMSDIILNTEGVTDLTKKRELIFLGPDENTADLMD